MFTRAEVTYDLAEGAVERVLQDEANPLHRIAKMIDDGAMVLDVGAGNGLLALVVSRTCKGVVIDGIEPDPYAAAMAKRLYRRFFVGAAEDFWTEIEEGGYNFVVLADVIEHMSDPLGFLEGLNEHLGEDARILVSVPNVAFASVRISLLNGQFDYVDSGLLERTHVRFFTLKTIKALAETLGMGIERILFLERDWFSTEIALGHLSACPCTILQVARDRTSSTYQFVIALSKLPAIPVEEHFGAGANHPFLKYLLQRTYVESVFHRVFWYLSATRAK